MSIINYILFDGVCNLCNGSVQFVIKHDKNAVFSFASLQSEKGQHLLSTLGLVTKQLDSIILIENQKVYTKSTAALRIALKLDNLIPLLYISIIIPRFIRDAVYQFISRNRYKWFGKTEDCWIPSEDLRNRFL